MVSNGICLQHLAVGTLVAVWHAGVGVSGQRIHRGIVVRCPQLQRLMGGTTRLGNHANLADPSAIGTRPCSHLAINSPLSHPNANGLCSLWRIGCPRGCFRPRCSFNVLSQCDTGCRPQEAGAHAWRFCGRPAGRRANLPGDAGGRSCSRHIAGWSGVFHSGETQDIPGYVVSAAHVMGMRDGC